MDLLLLGQVAAHDVLETSRVDHLIGSDKQALIATEELSFLRPQVDVLCSSVWTKKKDLHVYFQGVSQMERAG